MEEGNLHLHLLIFIGIQLLWFSAFRPHPSPFAQFNAAACLIWLVAHALRATDKSCTNEMDIVLHNSYNKWCSSMWRTLYRARPLFTLTYRGQASDTEWD